MSAASLSLAVIGPPAELAIAESVARQIATDSFGPDVPVVVRRFKQAPELAGHVLALVAAEMGPAVVQRASGCSRSAASAIHAALGEVVERTLGSRWQPNGSRAATARELRTGGHRVFDVARHIGRPRHEPWPYPRFHDDLVLEWVAARDFFTAEEVWVPVRLVGLTAADEPGALTEVTSNGMAAGIDLEAARTAALLELVERDTLIRRWNEGRPFSRIPADLVSETPGADQVDGWRTDFLYTDTPFETQVFLALTRHSDVPLYAMGAASALTVTDGITRAVAEAVKGRFARLRETRTESGSIVDFRSRRQYYCHADRIHRLTRLIGPTKRLNRQPADMASVQRRLADAHVEIVELVLHDAADAVVRLLAAGLHAMRGNEVCVTELQGVPQAVNLDPHPFG